MAGAALAPNVETMTPNVESEGVTMGAVKRFYEDCAEAGRCPVTREAFDYLDDLESARQIDWIGYCEHDYTGRDGRLRVEDCITLEYARRLVAEGMANDEIVSFVECFGDCYRPCVGCGHAEPIALVSRHGERFCADCQ